MSRCKLCNTETGYIGYHDCFNVVVNSVGLSRIQIAKLEEVYYEQVKLSHERKMELDEYKRKFELLVKVFDKVLDV